MPAQHPRSCLVLSVALVGALPLAARAAEAETSQARASQTALTTYDAGFFAAFAPATALDIVRRVPGFSLDIGNAEVRGLADAAGNVVLNGARPTSKSDTLDTVLGRIPARRVLRVELGPGSLFGSDYASRSQVLNLVLSAERGVEGSLQAKLSRVYDGRVIPNLEANALIRRGATTVSLSALSGRNDNAEQGYDLLRDVTTGALVERRTKINRYAPRNPSLALNTSWEPAANRAAHLNLRWAPGSFAIYQTNRVEPAGRPQRDDRLYADYHQPGYEAGGDMTLPLAGGAIKAVVLANRRDADTYDANFNRLGGANVGGYEQFSHSRYDELAGRLIWTRAQLAGMAVELGGEVASNTLTDASQLYALNGSGARVPVILPVANATVSELRGEGWVQAGRALGRNLRLDARLAYERSSLEVSGDATTHRSLGFLKPSLTLDWKGAGGWHAQASLRRTVAQLNFFDFIANAELASGQISGGNANLFPQRAWEGRLTLDHPLLGKGLAKLELGYDRVSALQDRILTPAGFDAPGNLGEASRRFARLTLDAPLDRLGLKQTRLRAEGRVQTTAVADPLTGTTRGWSGFWPGWDWQVEARRDFAKLSLGLTMQDRAPTAIYLTDEVDRRGSLGPFATLFAEYRPDKQTTMRLDVDNLFDLGSTRDRSFYAPSRVALSPTLDEYRFRNSHPMISATLRRTFSQG